MYGHGRCGAGVLLLRDISPPTLRTPRGALCPCEHRPTVDLSKPVRLPLLWKWMAAFSRPVVDAWPCRCGRRGDGETHCSKVRSNDPSKLAYFLLARGG